MRQVDPAGFYDILALLRKLGFCSQQIVGKAQHRQGLIFGLRMKITLQRCSQFVTVPALQCCRVAFKPAIEHRRQLLHALGHADITDAELADRMIDVLEECIDDLLGNLLAGTL